MKHPRDFQLKAKRRNNMWKETNRYLLEVVNGAKLVAIILIIIVMVIQMVE